MATADITVAAQDAPMFVPGMRVRFLRNTPTRWMRFVAVFWAVFVDGPVVDVVEMVLATRAWRRFRRWLNRLRWRFFPGESYEITEVTSYTLTVNRPMPAPAMGDLFVLE